MQEKKKYVKRSTFSAYALIVANHLLPAFGGREDVMEEDVQCFVLEKLSGGLSQKYVKDIILVLKMILKYAVKHEFMPAQASCE